MKKKKEKDGIYLNIFNFIILKIFITIERKVFIFYI